MHSETYCPSPDSLARIEASREEIKLLEAAIRYEPRNTNAFRFNQSEIRTFKLGIQWLETGIEPLGANTKSRPYCKETLYSRGGRCYEPQPLRKKRRPGRAQIGRNEPVPLACRVDVGLHI